jgi:hypothetical protein
MQRVTIQNAIYEYAEEVPAYPATDLSEEESLWLELMVMIDEGHFSEEKVKIHMFGSATVQNGRFSIKCKRPRRGEKGDCWVLIAERRAQDNGAGQHDLWMHCAVALTRITWFCAQDHRQKQLKLIFGSGQRLVAVQTKFGNTMFNEGK